MPQDVRIKVDVVGDAQKSLEGIVGSLDKMAKAGSSGGPGAAALVGVTVGLYALKEAAEFAVESVLKVAGAIAEFAIDSVEYAIEVESAFAGIIKTVDGLGDSYFDLTDLGEQVLQDFKDLATVVPQDLTELMGVGELAGQLGVMPEVLADFTKAIAAFGVATDVSMEEATNNVAKFLNIFGVSQDEFVDHAERAMAAIVDVGNKYSSTEKEILDGAQRLAQISIFGFSEADVIGLANAWASLGLAPDAYGNSMAKFMRNVDMAVDAAGRHLDTLARVAGVSAEEFAQAWADDPAQAFLAFVAGLSEGGEKATDVIEELGTGWKDARIIRAITVAAGGYDMFAGSIRDANLAYEENIALMIEAERRWATTESLMGMATNIFNNWKLALGEPVLEAFNGHMQTLVELMRDPAFTDFMGVMGDGLATILDDLVEVKIPLLLTALGVDGLEGGLGSAEEAMQKFVDWFTDPKVNEGLVETVVALRQFAAGMGLLGAEITWVLDQATLSMFQLQASALLLLGTDPEDPALIKALDNVAKATENVQESKSNLEEARTEYHDLLAEIEADQAAAMERIEQEAWIGSYNAGVNMTQGFKYGIEEHKAEAIDAAHKLAVGMSSRVKDDLYIKSPSLVFYNIGTDVIDGWINGMNARKYSLFNLAASIAAQVAATIAGALQIQSPSKVTEYLGAQTVEGFKVGMQKASGQMLSQENKFMPTININNPSVRNDGDIKGITQQVMFEMKKMNNTYRGGFSTGTV